VETEGTVLIQLYIQSGRLSIADKHFGAEPKQVILLRRTR